jgi:hypothetical protein
MTTRSYTQKDFLQNYEFPLHPSQDFTLNGIASLDAPGHPLEWGLEKDGFDFWGDIEQNFGNKSPERHGDMVSLPTKFIRGHSLDGCLTNC